MSIKASFAAIATRRGTDRILSPLRPQLDALDACLKRQVGAFEPEVQPLVEYVFGHSGKKIRPVLVFSAGWQENGEVRDELVRAAAILELVHLATLVHDDILDDAEMRHQTETARSRYGSHAAVLLGDALFAHALKMAADFPTVEVCRAVAESTRQVCCGEIAQTFARGETNLSLERYYRMIDLKTAELFAVAAWLGASLGSGDLVFADAAARFARHLGIAYQIYDDLADLVGEEAKAGKTLGTDLASGKYTLPVLLWLQLLPEGEGEVAVERLRAGDVAGLRTKLFSSGAVAGVRERFENELEKGRQSLAAYSNLESTARLLLLTQFVEDAFARLPKQ